MPEADRVTQDVPRTQTEGRPVSSVSGDQSVDFAGDPFQILRLQHHAGNRAVGRLVAKSETYERGSRALYGRGTASSRGGDGEQTNMQTGGARLLRAAVAAREDQRLVEPQQSLVDCRTPDVREIKSGLGLLQRQSVEPEPVQSTKETGVVCGGVGWKCAVGAECDVPDTTRPADPAGAWHINMAIDIEAENSSDVDSSTAGHVFVEFIGADGKSWTYGFYPSPTDKPTTTRWKVFGCMVHPDTIHAKCVDHRERYTVTAAQYQTALAFAQAFCKGTPQYDLQHMNCTTFAVKIAEAAGQAVPTYHGQVGVGGGMGADNPNTLLETIRQRDIPTRGLTGDTEIRHWLRDHTYAEIGKLPEAEKLRLINRLLKGYVHDDDLEAVHWVCGGVIDKTEMDRIDAAVRPQVKGLNARQGAWLARILDYRPH
jgi:hypothetical protein